jgi:hypothetical protein
MTWLAAPSSATVSAIGPAVTVAVPVKPSRVRRAASTLLPFTASVPLAAPMRTPPSAMPAMAVPTKVGEVLGPRPCTVAVPVAIVYVPAGNVAPFTRSASLVTLRATEPSTVAVYPAHSALTPRSVVAAA